MNVIYLASYLATLVKMTIENCQKKHGKMNILSCQVKLQECIG